jgi:hypothetical protein
MPRCLRQEWDAGPTEHWRTPRYQLHKPMPSAVGCATSICSRNAVPFHKEPADVDFAAHALWRTPLNLRSPFLTSINDPISRLRLFQADQPRGFRAAFCSRGSSLGACPSEAFHDPSGGCDHRSCLMTDSRPLRSSRASLTSATVLTPCWRKSSSRSSCDI